MSPREEFLRALFRILDEKSVPYCVLRNYANIYENTSSDVDVAVEPHHVLRFKDCLAEAAVASNHHLVLRARYVNYSYVYWHNEGGFIRVDIETEVRWRIFPVLTAKAVVGLRRREGVFHVPHPRHESAILWVAAVWRGHLSDRYRNQLARLYQQAATPLELQRTFNASFGAIGQKLAATQSNILNQTFDPSFWKSARWSIIRNAFRDRPCRRALLCYLAWDLKRLWERLRHLPGISILYVSAAQPGRDLKDLFQRMRLLYPFEKSDIHSFSISPADGKPFRRLGLWLRVRRLFVLFKGGLFMRFYQLARDSDIPRILQTHTRYLFPSRTFICAEDSQFRIWLGHVETGFTAQVNSLTTAPVSNDQVIRFISAILEHYPVRGERRPQRRGAFVVLAGLDASTRSAVAHHVCNLALAAKRFYRVRCFHWPPHLRRESFFPLRDLDNRFDKPRPEDNLLPSHLSVPQICKNLLLANVGNWLRLRSLLRRNSLVLFDGYDYDYLLDPTAVKSFGPERLLARLLRLYPRPDLLVELNGPTAALRSRGQALSEEKTLRQTAVFELLRFDAQHTLQVDASSPPLEIARVILRQIAMLVP